MKYYIWANGDPSVGINGCDAKVEVAELENWYADDDPLQQGVESWLKDELQKLFSELFGEPAFIMEDTSIE